jgi:hypothetical protein
MKEFKIGDTVINDKKEKGIIFLSFFITNNTTLSTLHDKDKITEGLWVCSEDFKRILNFSNSFEMNFVENTQKPDSNTSTKTITEADFKRSFRRSKVLLLEKDMNIILEKDTAKKFSSNLIKFLSQVKK